MDVINSDLNEACKEGDAIKVRSIISRYNVTYSSLLIALDTQHDEIISLQLDYIEMNGEEQCNKTLNWATDNRHIKILELAKKRGWNINKVAESLLRESITNDPNQLLHKACIHGSLEVVKTLIESGAKINQSDSLLSRALQYGKIEIAQLLVEKGALLHFSCLSEAAKLEGDRAELVEMMIMRGAHVGGLPCRHVPLFNAVTNANEKTVKVLLNHCTSVLQNTCLLDALSLSLSDISEPTRSHSVSCTCIIKGGR